MAQDYIVLETENDPEYLVKMLIIEGFDCFGKLVKFTKLTNSSRSLYDYKETLVEDYEKNHLSYS